MSGTITHFVSIALFLLFVAVIHLDALQDQPTVQKPQKTTASSPATSTAVDTRDSRRDTPESISPPQWYKSSEWWLVITAALTVIVAALTGLFIAGQTKETARAARASEKNVDALVNSVRAWLMVELDLHNKDGVARLGKVFKASSPEGDRTMVSAFLRVWNEGRVPAWITDISIWGELVQDIPLHPDTTGAVIYHLTGPLPMGLQGIHEQMIEIGFDGWNPGPGGQGSIIHGVVTYRDAFGSDRKTWFAYAVRNGSYLDRLARFPEYNKNT